MSGVFLYVPNIIGYFRIVLLIVAYFVLDFSFVLFAVTYFTSFVLDAFDGMAARKFNQTSRFGEYIDMLSDRMGTLMLSFVCVSFSDTSFKGAFVLYSVLDICAHWLQQVVAVMVGGHHKHSRTLFTFLNMYYASKKLMVTLCLGGELVFLTHIYRKVYGDKGAFALGLELVFAVLAGLKTVTNLQQIASNSITLAEFPPSSPR